MGWREFFDGLGYSVTLDQGNRAVPMGDPPVPVGPFQWIQPQLFQNPTFTNVGSFDMFIDNAGFDDWQEMAANEFGPSGLTGGGVAWDTPELDTASTANFDIRSGDYDFSFDDPGE